MNTRLHPSLLSSILALSCVSTTGDGTKAERDPEPDVAAQGGTPMPSAAAAGPTPPLEVVVEADPEPAAPVVPALHLYADAGARIDIHALLDDRFAVSVGPQLIPVSADGSLKPDPTLLNGVRHPRDPGADNMFALNSWHALSVGGRWPDNIIMSTTIEDGFRGEDSSPNVMRFDGQRWSGVKSAAKLYSWNPVEFSPWIDGSILARRIFEPEYPEGDVEDGESRDPTEEEIASRLAAIQRAKPVVVVRGLPKAPDLGLGGVASFRSWANGEILAVSAQPQPELRVAGLAGVRSTMPLPLPAGAKATINGIVASAPDSALIFGATQVSEGDAKPYLARWNGKTLEALPGPPVDDALGSLQPGDDGTLWAISGDTPYIMYSGGDRTLWHRTADGVWFAAALPELPNDPDPWGGPHRIAWVDGALWVAVGSKLLRTTPTKEVIKLPDLETIGRLAFEYSDPVALGKSCSVPLMRLQQPVTDAEKVKAQLDPVLTGLENTGTTALRRASYRGDPTLVLELPAGIDLKDVRRVERKARAVLDPKPHAAQCLSTREHEEEIGLVGDWDNWD